MKNMKQLLALALVMTGVTSSLMADFTEAVEDTGNTVVEGFKTAGRVLDNKFFSQDTHYFKCKNGTLSSANCNARCSNSGWSGDYILTNKGITCICKNGSKETVNGSGAKYCVKSGWAGEVYDVADGEFKKAPVTK